MDSNDPVSVVNAVAESVIADYDPTDIGWDWGEGVLMTGMIRADDLVDHSKCRQFVQQWADSHRPSLGDHLARTRHDVNFWAPGYPCLRLGETLDDDTYREMAHRVVEYMFANGPRLQNGAFAHNSRDLSRQIWVDTAWHATPLLARSATVFDEPEYLTEANRQLQLFSAHAQDTQSGLFYHLYDEAEDAVNGVFWGRGNGWMAMAYADVLTQSDTDSWAVRDLIHQHSRLLDGLVAEHGESGLWHTVVDEHDTYTETSVSAMVLYSLLQVRKQELFTYPQVDEEAIWRALVGRVDGDGHVTGVSGGTPTGQDAAHYDTIERGRFHWGTGVFLMAATAMAGT